MSSLNLRRAIVWIVSPIVGIVASLLIVLIIGTDVATFGFELVFVVVALAVVALIWLDYFLSAEILPE